MIPNQDLPRCDEGIEEKVKEYPEQCTHCNHQGEYKYKGDDSMVCQCDYYEEKFKKPSPESITEKTPEYKRPTTKIIGKRKPFDG